MKLLIIFLFLFSFFISAQTKPDTSLIEKTFRDTRPGQDSFRMKEWPMYQVTNGSKVSYFDLNWNPIKGHFFGGGREWKFANMKEEEKRQRRRKIKTSTN